MNAQNLALGLLPEAWQCYHRGDLARAEELGQRVLAADRNQPQALNLLGFVAHRAGRPEVAIARLRLAVQSNPTNPDCHNNLGILCNYAGQLSEAESYFRQALRLHPQFPEAYNNLSSTLNGLGRLEEALEAGEQALRLRPAFAEANNHVGLALLELGRNEEAAAQFRQAVQRKPQLREAHRNLGKALVEQGLLSEGIVCFEHALQLDPGFAEAHCDLGEALKQLGCFEEAVVHLREALRSKPDYAMVYWILGQFASQGYYQFTEEEIGRVRMLLESKKLSVLDRSVLVLVLAEVFEKRGFYDAAFQHYRQAGALRTQYLRSIDKAFDPAEHQALVERLIGFFDEECLRPSRLVGSDSELPVFVVGMPRSGTTLIEQILCSHSQMAGAGELPNIEQMVDHLTRVGGPFGGYPACLRSFQQNHLRDLADRYLGRLSQFGNHAERVIDKMPQNFMHLGIIALLFPNARVIHCRRDPLDVCLSCYFQNFHRVNFSWSLDDLGVYHREYERLMAHWQRVLPLRMFEVRYEDLVARQEVVSRELVAFCGLKWEDRCLAFHKNPRAVKTASALQVRQPMYSSSVGRWKKYASHLEPLRQALRLPTPISKAGRFASFPGEGAWELSQVREQTD